MIMFDENNLLNKWMRADNLHGLFLKGNELIRIQMESKLKEVSISSGPIFKKIIDI